MRTTIYFDMFIILIMLFLSGEVRANTEIRVSPLRAVFFELAPHGFLLHGKPSGAAVDYLKLVMAEMNQSADFEQRPLTRIVQMTEAALIIYLGRNPERLKKLQFNEEPLFQMQGVFVVHKSSNWKDTIKGFEEVGEKTIGVWASGYRSQNLELNRLKLVQFHGNDVIQRGLEIVNAKRIDAFYCPDAEAVKYFLMKEPKLAKSLRVIQLPEPPTGIYPAFTKSVSEDTRKRFSAAFARVQKKQPYSVFLANYLK